MPEIFNECRQDGYEHNGHDYECEVVFHNPNIPEEIAAEKENHDPGYTANDIEGNEPAIIHFSYAGHEGGIGSNDRHVLGKNDCFSAMALIEPVSPIQIILFKEAAIRPFKNAGSDYSPDGIIYRVA